jgi:hypothetical protein
VRKHRLSRSGFARDRIEARAEAKLGPFDQQQVLDPKLEQHPSN